MQAPVHVTVIVVNWNAAAYLGRTLHALQQQTYSAFDVLVVDNASSDGSQHAVAALQDPRFALLQLPANLGFAKANNLAVQQSQASHWIALLNPDAFPQNDWLEQLMAIALQRPDVGALGSALINAQDPTEWDGTGDCYHLSGRAFRRDHGRPRQNFVRQAGEIFAPCAAAALYSKKAWQQVGGFDEDFFCYLEDVDLGFRFQLLGYKSLYVPQAICQHVGSAFTGRRSEFSTYHGQRNLVWVFTKNMPTPLLLALLPLHVMVNLFAVGLFALRGQLKTVLKAKFDALCGLPACLRKRRQIQQTRTITLTALWRMLDKQLWPR